MSNRAAKFAWALGILLLVVLIVLNCAGCSGVRAQAHVALPTAATVDALVGAPARRAQASNSQVIDLAALAEKSGIAAGSATARTLTLAAAQNRAALNDVLAGKDTLTAQLLGDQKQIDVLEKHDTTETQLAVAEAVTIKKVEHSRWIWRGLFLLSLVLDYFFGAFIEARLRGVVSFAWKWIASGYHLVAGVLKAMLPLYTFWLPA